MVDTNKLNQLEADYKTGNLLKNNRRLGETEHNLPARSQ